MTSNHRPQVKDNIEFNTLRNYTKIHYTYQLLYCKGRIQMTSNHSNENVETKIDNRVNKMTTLNLIHLKIIQQYIVTLQYIHLSVVTLKKTHSGHK